MAKLIQDMRLHSAGEKISDVSADKAPAADSSEISAAVRRDVEEKMEKIRVDGIPAKVYEMIALIEANDEILEKVELSVCRISDTEITRLIGALKNNTHLKRLNLAFNQITDAGIQALVTALASGAAKGLEEINVSNNQFGEMGQRILGGLGFIRKNLKVIAESSI